jgi:hypothetical protein
MELYKSEKLLLKKDSSFQPDSESKVFWKSLQEALKANKKGIDGKTRILSIIAENFKYNKKLKEELKVNFQFFFLIHYLVIIYSQYFIIIRP